MTMKLVRPRVCESCGYDLRGIQSRICPECGEFVPSPRMPPQWWVLVVILLLFALTWILFALYNAFGAPFA